MKHVNELTANDTPVLSPPVANSMGATARVAVATGSGAVGSYSMTVFTGWDYGSLDQNVTILKQKKILYQLQVRGKLPYVNATHR